MKFEYRKFLEPKYGKISPGVYMENLIPMDERNIPVWRKKYIFDTVTTLNNYWSNRRCFPDLMEVETSDFLLPQRDGYQLPVRIYRPAGEGCHPMVLLFHGGGFAMNNLDVYDMLARYIALYGEAVVIAPEYRLAPEYKFPTGLEDCYETLLWAESNAKNIQGALSGITVCGDSSGGNFATAISIMARDRKGPRIHKQILIYPVTYLVKADERTHSELEYGEGYELDYDSTKESLVYYLSEEKDRFSVYASPFLASLKDLPPACFISAECDALLDQGLMYAAKLQDAGVPVEYHVYEGMPHGFINRPYGKTFDAMNDICNALPRV
ncbi:alpha/beta hydrolase [uncultured Sphaerochaeta sp.]|uniref:alpha/beta hydrolase n=1 Tax=uncultured Sphaerochaeta sp. TaxID=886478 RepID=UPI002A0A3048|nr:alpha/beta hydrolase [uncultured Sphaerochaeta sp.]